MPIIITNPICEFDNFDCIVEAKCNRIDCDLTRRGRASGEYNTNRVPHTGEKHGWFASNRSQANDKLVITVTGPFIAKNDIYGRVETLTNILKSCLELAHNKGCASIKIPMLSSLVYVKESDRIQPAEFSEVELFLYHDNASALSDEFDMDIFLGYDPGVSNHVLGFKKLTNLDDDGDASILCAKKRMEMLVYTPSYLEGEKNYVYSKELQHYNRQRNNSVVFQIHRQTVFLGPKRSSIAQTGQP